MIEIEKHNCNDGNESRAREDFGGLILIHLEHIYLKKKEKNS
jgi:hypothetical protein